MTMLVHDISKFTLFKRKIKLPFKIKFSKLIPFFILFPSTFVPPKTQSECFKIVKCRKTIFKDKLLFCL